MYPCPKCASYVVYKSPFLTFLKRQQNSGVIMRLLYDSTRVFLGLFYKALLFAALLLGIVLCFGAVNSIRYNQSHLQFY